MVDASGSEKRPLDEVMLAMDVVDTLRHRQVMVERELGAEDRDRKLIERLRELYASQGIDVPDQVLAEGVAALRENRFTYTPPKPGLAVSLARIYIDRGKWAKGALAVLGAVLALWVGYTFVVKSPGERRLKRQVASLNAALESAEERLESAASSIGRVGAALNEASVDAPQSLEAAIVARRASAEKSLQLAGGLLQSARELAHPPDLTVETYPDKGKAAQDRLGQQQALLDRADESIGTAEGKVAEIRDLKAAAVETEAAWRDFQKTNPPEDILRIGEAVYARTRAALQGGDAQGARAQAAQLANLGVIPRELAAQRQAILAQAKVAEASARADRLYADALAALRDGDAETAQSAVSQLKALRLQLEQEYTLQIVSRPGESSGVWRVPERNPSAKNFYIIVEAVTPDGRVLTVPVTSEEDGRTSNVTKWGLRVSERVFQQIRADKEDDGIIQARRFGVKRRGHLKPEYLVPTTGAAITKW